MSSTTRRRAVVTGGAGFLGCPHLCETLLATNYEVLCLDDNFVTGVPANVAHLMENPNFRLVRANVPDYVHVGDQVDAVLPLCLARVADRLSRATHSHAQGRVHRHLARAWTGEGEGCTIPALGLFGDVRRSACPPASGCRIRGNVNPVGPAGCL